uniref:Uncharacterized protein n=1 Tax=Anguilla anguilla TaxID=7936 RepID=A0A0E9W4R7_ANGAN
MICSILLQSNILYLCYPIFHLIKNIEMNIFSAHNMLSCVILESMCIPAT